MLSPLLVGVQVAGLLIAAVVGSTMSVYSGECGGPTREEDGMGWSAMLCVGLELALQSSAWHWRRLS